MAFSMCLTLPKIPTNGPAKLAAFLMLTSL